eukprot:TRINITY_DN31159_c0_g2_i1.p1 TRINITY_DN31159_c0_g2~~TRINITY_DN31159_c0_g2_i1.p1  ORF type:complete len:347 (-),score=36.23 TRINITY_DN31159_c0_g2_i1:128-1168(-)
MLRALGFLFAWPLLPVCLSVRYEADSRESEAAALAFDNVSLLRQESSLRRATSLYVSRGESENRMALAMAELADAVSREKEVRGWTRIAGFRTNDHAVSLYQEEEDSTCAIAISSGDALDLVNGVGKLRTFPVCGVNMYVEFVTPFFEMVKSKEWEEHIASEVVKTECTEVYLTGHGKGGALASIFAGCAYQKDKDPTMPQVRRFTVHGLYTTGAPGVSSTPLVNYSSPDGCFRGWRTVSFDESTYDPVPYSTSRNKLWHPKMTLVRLEKTTDVTDSRGGLRARRVLCTSPHAPYYPYRVKWYWVTQLDLNNIEEYKRRLKSLFRRGSMEFGSNRINYNNYDDSGG